MNYIKNNKKKSGFSLLELVLAIAIFSFGSIVIAILLIDSNISARLYNERTEALFYAREGVEATRAIRDASWLDLVDGDHGLVSLGDAWAFDGSSDYIRDKYTRRVNIVTNSSSTKNISVVMEWNFTPVRKSSIILDSILTKWK